MDLAGNTYLCGNSSSADIATSGAYQDSLSLPWDGFLMKFDKNGQRNWGTYLNGFNPNDIAINLENKLILAGDSGLVKFDENGQFEWLVSRPGRQVAVICDKSLNIITVGDSVRKMNPQGLQIWSRKYGGPGTTAKDVGCDTAGNIYFTGHTTDSSGIATPNAYLTTYNGTNYIGTGFFFGMESVGSIRAGDGFFTKIDQDGNLIYGSYYGGYYFDDILRIAVSDSGSFVLAGVTNSRNGIASPGAFQDTLRYQSSRCFVQINIGFNWECPDGYWQYLDTCISNGNCFRPLPYDNNCQSTDAFLVKFNPDGVRDWGTYYGDTGSEHTVSVDINSSGEMIVLAGYGSGNGSVRPTPETLVNYPPNLSTPYSYHQSGCCAYVAQFLGTGERSWGTYYPKDEVICSPWSIPADVHTADSTVIVTGTCNYNYGLGCSWNYNTFQLYLRNFVFSDFYVDTIIDPLHIAPCFGDSIIISSRIVSDPPVNLDFQWYRNEVLLPGMTDSIVCINSLSSSDTGNYICKISQPNSPWYWFTNSANLSGRDKPAFKSLQKNNNPFEIEGLKGFADMDDDGLPDIIASNRIIYSDSLQFNATDSISLIYGNILLSDINTDNRPDLSGDSKILKMQSGGITSIENSLLNGILGWADFDNDGAQEGFKMIFSGFYLIELTPDTIFQKEAGNAYPIYDHLPKQVSFNDYDNDGDIDVLVSHTFRIYLLTNEKGYFHTDISPITFTSPYCFAAKWFDADSDGDLDILFKSGISGLFLDENINGNYTRKVIDTVNGSCVIPEFCDLDNDGYFDIIEYYYLYNFDGNGYNLIPTGYNQGMPGINDPANEGRISAGDLDRDGDLDIPGEKHIFVNYPCNDPNTPPSSPFNLQTSVNQDTVRFSWRPATDAQTPSPGLTYNLRVGTNPGGHNIMSPLADSTGWRKVAGMGNVYQNTTWWLHGLDEGIYYWSVQAIDNSFAGGPFSVQDTFAIILPIDITIQPVPETVCLGDTIRLEIACNHFFPLTYQWYKDSIPIPDGTDRLLLISPVNELHDGYYHCLVSNQQFSLNTDTVKINIIDVPDHRITLFQESLQRCVGDSIVLKARKLYPFFCHPLSFQWYFENEPLAGQNDSLLIINSLDSAFYGEYFCKVSNESFSTFTDTVKINVIDVPHHRIALFQESLQRCVGDSIVLKARKQYPFFCHPLSFQWYFENEPLTGNNDSLLIINSLDSTFYGEYFCKVSNESFSTFTDTLNLILHTTQFISDSVFTNGQHVFTELNLDGNWDIFKSLSLYSQVNNSNITDLDRDGIPDHIARQDSVRFFQQVANNWIPFGITLPEAYQIRARDVNNDGDVDFLIHKGSYDAQLTAIIKMQDTSYDQTVIDQKIMWGTMDLVDFDNDSDFDILLTGYDYGQSRVPKTSIWKNIGGVFEEIITNLPGFWGATTDWADYDNDGDLDLLVSGIPDHWTMRSVTKIFRNENGVLTENNVNLPVTGQVLWLDYDNDGLLDIKIGNSIFWQQDGSFILTEINGHDGLLFDYDNDGDIDIWGCWYVNYWSNGNEIFLNESCTTPNTPPTYPTNLQTSIAADTVHFSWYPAADAQTPSPGLSYNMRVGTTPGGCQIMSPMSNPSGFRQVVELGNVQQNLGWWLHNLQPGTYYWSVQAIDNSFAGGPFAPEQMFEILAATHNISVPEGWSGLSSWANPNNDAIENVFLPIQNQLTILQTMEEMYFPSQNINTIGNWENQSAFKIKVTDDCTLNITGIQEQNKSITLEAGWNLAPVICNLPVDPVPLFSPVSSDLKIIKDVAGTGVYWPEYGINTIGNLWPGKAYYIRMLNPCSITFPPNDFSGLKREVVFPELPEISSPWGAVIRTPSSHTIAIPANVSLSLQEDGIIGAFTAEGLLAGLAKIDHTGGNVLVLQMDDPLSPYKDGFTEGEPMAFKLWDEHLNQELPLTFEFDTTLPDHTGQFVPEGLSAVKSISIAAGASVSEIDSEGVRIIPNPAKDEVTVYLPELWEGTKVIKILTIDGQPVKKVSTLAAIQKIQIGELSAGVYLVEISNDHKTVTQRLIKH